MKLIHLRTIVISTIALATAATFATASNAADLPQTIPVSQSEAVTPTPTPIATPSATPLETSQDALPATSSSPTPVAVVPEEPAASPAPTPLGRSCVERNVPGSYDAYGTTYAYALYQDCTYTDGTVKTTVVGYTNSSAVLGGSSE
jgi:hypothetical protein